MLGKKLVNTRAFNSGAVLLTHERALIMATIATIDAYLDTLPEPLREIGRTLRPVIDAGLPEAEGVVWHGHPVWKIGTTPVALLKAYTSYVTFGLFRGQLLADPSGRLEPGTREMASVKLRTVEEIDQSLFTGWLRQAQELGRS